MKIYKRIMYIALPIAFENMIFSLINFVDIFMIGKIGASAISALGIANEIFFIFSCAVYGILSGANVLAAQYYGKKDYKNLRKIMCITIGLGLILSFPFIIIVLINPEILIKFYTNDTSVINYAKSYFSISIYTFPLYTLGFSLAMQLRAVNKPKYSLYSSIAALFVNIFLNILLIPKLGVAGAAIATLISRVIMTIYLYFSLYLKKIPILPNISDMRNIDLEFIKKVFVISSLTFVHELIWAIIETIKVMIYGKLGTNSFSAIQIVLGISGLLFTLFTGISNASSIIIGNEIGADNKEKVYGYANKCLKLFAFVTVLVVVSLNLFSPILLKFMNLENTLYHITKTLIISQSIAIVFYAYSTFFLSGILRSGGDVKFCVIVEILAMLLIGIPATYLSVYVFNLSVYFVYVISRIDDLVKIYPCILRYVSKKWIKKAI